MMPKSIQQAQFEISKESIGDEANLCDFVYNGFLGSQPFKNILINSDFEQDCFKVLADPEFVTEEMTIYNKETDRFGINALKNCRNLIKLSLNGMCQGLDQRLETENLRLEQFEVNRIFSLDSANDTLIGEVLSKCIYTLTTLRLQNCSKFSLFALRDSKILKQLKIVDCNEIEGKEVIATLSNLEELDTNDLSIIQAVKAITTLKRLTINSKYNSSYSDVIPPSVKSVYLTEEIEFQSVFELLEKNIQIREVTISMFSQGYQVALLQHTFKHVKFTYLYSSGYECEDSPDPFTFRQAFNLVNPKIQQPVSPSNPDHRLYELLVQRLKNPKHIYEPYLLALCALRDSETLMRVNQVFAHFDQRMLHLIETFSEFEQCLKKLETYKGFKSYSKNYITYFDDVFECQMVYNFNDEYLRIIVSSYDEAFELGGNVEETITRIKIMSDQERFEIAQDRDRYFDLCRANWQQNNVPFLSKNKTESAVCIE
ncbi:hypothetical protein FGO68_gene4069 [Halteria grandinella]|uniref:Uncharacterized protein n=1 Tax=Halteria grandinella TaxID=5974 RepID=A0A8J8T6I5_HALGN|nr:hypothetical protein FGO68_gene4069 [Halteria grandinella]